jgi:hypothetical protein
MGGKMKPATSLVVVGGIHQKMGGGGDKPLRVEEGSLKQVREEGG